MIKKWCTACKKDTHDTAECWWSGTICVSSSPDPVFAPSVGLVPNAKPAMSGELRAAIDKVLGRYDLYGKQGDGEGAG